MQSCELLMSISALACCIAENHSSEEISFLAAIFSQLGESLSTIEAQKDLCHSKANSAPDSSKNNHSC